jgi:hypothetical protein
MAAVADPLRLLPPAARAELHRYPLTDAEGAAHADCPLGAAAGWYYCGAGCGLLALALHELTGLPYVGVLSALEAAADDGDEFPLDVMLEAGVGGDERVLCACGWRAAVEGAERLAGVDEADVRALCSDADGADPDDPPTAEAAREAARLLLERLGCGAG